MMRAFLRPRALGALAGALLLGVAAWILSPLLGDAFDATWLRALVALLPLPCWAGAVWWIERRRAARDAALVAEAAAPAPEDGRGEALAREEEELRGKLAEALGRLKAAAGSGGASLYELPWYVIIGPPGTGKTTALLNSGLSFPLAEGRVAGVGGTRSCDWWLSEQAVLIDTAGRYTSQDSDAAADRAGWERFLDLLRRNRPRQPLNGVLVAFGTDFLARMDAAEREGHARAIRRRVKEMESRLGQRLPVYMLLTKADLLPGFAEFFDDLDKAGRDQVWGFTLPPEVAADALPALLRAEFAALSERLLARLNSRLQQERGPRQRALIAGFPAQVASLEAPVCAFLEAAFGGSRLDPAPMLRGAYLTSGTQEGTPLDRLAGTLSRSFGLQAARPAALVPQRGRAFFLGALLRQVVFREARLAAKDRGAERRRVLVQAASWGIAALALLGALAWGWNARSVEAARAARLAEAVAAAEQAGAAAPVARVAGPDLTRVIAYLEATRALPPAAQGEGPGMGLSQEGPLGAAADAAYRRALERVLLPRLLARLEEQVAASLQRPEVLYEAVRVYLMLGGQGPMDAALVREWFALDWRSSFAGAVNQPGRDALGRHLDALLAAPLPAYPLDGALVDQARRVFSRLPMAQRVYSRLRAAAEVPDWAPAAALGPAGQRHFARASRRPLDEGVPGLFTVEGLHRAVLPRLPQAVLEAAGESWVLGPEAAVAGAGDPRRLEAEVLALYAADYVRAWEALLRDLTLRAPSGLPAAAEALNLLGAPNSPMKDLLRAVARQLSPGTPPEGMAQPAASAAAQRVATALGGGAEGGGAAAVARVVETRFQPLREAAGAPLDAVLAILNDLYVQVARLAAAPPGTTLPPAPGLDPGQRLLAEAQRQPEPLRGWLAGLAQSTQRARAGGAQAAIAAGGAQQLAPLCRGLEQRFPFRRQAGAPDMPVGDFQRLLGHGGLLDSFFAQSVRPYADVTQRPWRPVAVDGLAPPVSAADLAQFQRAQAIRDAFFPVPGATGFRFQIIPAGLSPGTAGAVLEAGGQRIALAPGGGGRPVELAFPSDQPVTLAFDPPSSQGDLVLDGPWAALRLAFQHRLAPTAQPDRFRLSVQRGDRSAEFTLVAPGSINPFNLRELGEFRCPALPPPG